jgi:hypothetical protein
MNNGFYNFPNNNLISAKSASYAISSSYALTASYALNGGGGGGGGGDFVPSAWTGSSTSQFSGTASFATTASSFRAGNSTIIDNGGFLRVSTAGLIVTGSFTVVTGSNTEFRVTNTGVTIGNIVTDVHNVTGSFNVSGSVLISGSTTIKGAIHNNESTTINLGRYNASTLVNIDSNDGSISLGDFNTSVINMLGNNTSILTGDGTFTTYNTNGGYFQIEANGNIKIGNDSSKIINITGSAKFEDSVVIDSSLSVATSTTSSLRTNPGTTTVAPIVIAPGSNLTTPSSGAIEYDGTVIYSTNDVSSRRGYIPSVNIFRLTGNGSAIGSTIANFFGANSAIQLAAGGIYEIEAECYFVKTTNGTVTVTASSSLAPVNINGVIRYGAAAGGSNTGVANQIAIANISTVAATFGASVSLTSTAGHAFNIKLLVEANANASNLRFLFTESAGTVTPLRGSYYKVTKLPSSNTGNFVA